MDEPFGAVDPIVRAQLQREFARLQRDLGKTVVFVTHDVDEAIVLGDRIAVLGNGGRLAQLDTPARAARQPGDDVRRRLPRRPHGRVPRRRRPSATGSTARFEPGEPGAATPPVHEDRSPADGRRRRVIAPRGRSVVERPPARRQLGRHLVLHAAARPVHGDGRRASASSLALPLAYSPCAGRRRTRCCWSSTNVIYAIPAVAMFVAAVAVARVHERQADRRGDGAVHARHPRPQPRRGHPRGARSPCCGRPTGWATGRSAASRGVELPLALPSIVAGLRLATVSTVSLISVGALIGRGGLGRLFTDGYERRIKIELWAGARSPSWSSRSCSTSLISSPGGWRRPGRAGARSSAVNGGRSMSERSSDGPSSTASLAARPGQLVVAATASAAPCVEHIWYSVVRHGRGRRHRLADRPRHRPHRQGPLPRRQRRRACGGRSRRSASSRSCSAWQPLSLWPVLVALVDPGDPADRAQHRRRDRQRAAGRARRGARHGPDAAGRRLAGRDPERAAADPRRRAIGRQPGDRHGDRRRLRRARRRSACSSTPARGPSSTTSWPGPRSP